MLGARLLVPLVAGAFVVGAAVNPAVAEPRGYQPQFEVVGCDSPQFAGRLPDREAQCGLLAVPE